MIDYWKVSFQVQTSMAGPGGETQKVVFPLSAFCRLLSRRNLFWFFANVELFFAPICHSISEGISNRDKNIYLNVLKSISYLRDNTYLLHRHLWNDVHEDWPFYSDQDRSTLKRWVLLIICCISTSMHNIPYISSIFLDENRKILHHHSRPMAAHPQRLVKVQIVNITVHHHRQWNVHRKRRWFQVMLSISTMTTTSSQSRRRSELVIWWMDVQRRIMSRHTWHHIHEQEIVMITMGELFTAFCWLISQAKHY